MAKKILIYTNHKRAANPRLRYCIDFLNSHPLNPQNITLDIAVSLPVDVEDKLVIEYNSTSTINSLLLVRPQNLFFHEAPASGLEYGIGMYSHDGHPIYSVEKAPEKQIYDFAEDGFLAFDIFETIFFHISRWEEYFISKEMLNEFGQIPDDELLLVQNKIQDVPVVDHLVRVFFTVLGCKMEDVKTSLALSHDIDHPFTFRDFAQSIHFAGSLLKRNPNKLPIYIKDWLLTKMGYGTDPATKEQTYLRTIEGMRKYIYFIVEGSHKLDPSIISHSEVSRLAQAALKQNYTIGLHPAFNTGSNKEALAQQKMILEKISGVEVTHNRFHFLQFHWPLFLDNLEQVGFTHDSTLGYARHLGFRCGTGFPYLLYNLTKDRESSVTEIPLVWMDSAARYSTRMLSKNFVPQSMTFFEKNRFNTHICMNLHNAVLYDYELYGISIKEFYDNILTEYGS